MKATVLAERLSFLSVLPRLIYALQQSASMSQIGVVPFSGISFYVNIEIFNILRISTAYKGMFDT